MFLSRLALNVNRRETMIALSSPQRLHAAVEGSFPPGQSARTLWRIDRLGEDLYLLLCSQHKPDMSHMVEQFGWPAADQQWQTRDYDAFLNNLAPGQTWQFRLRGNACKSHATQGKRGVVRPLVTVPSQEEWLFERAQKNGFILEKGAFKVVHQEAMEFTKSAQTVSLRAVVFEGLLQVADVDLLKTALTQGIGRGKAYGCGLLTLAPVPAK